MRNNKGRVLRKKMKNSPIWSIPKAKTTEKLESIRTPGPGSYQSLQFQSPKHSIGRSKRDDVYQIQSTPGPGYYNYNYSQNSLSSVPSKSILSGSSKKSQKFGDVSYLNDQYRETPGPGAYVPYSPIQFVKQKAPSRSSANGYGNGSLRVPGLQSFSKVPRWQQEQSRPGPGDYSTEISIKKKYYYISKTPRFHDQVNLQPGPGDYNTQSVLTKLPKFSTQKRFEQKAQMLPGPGDYNSNSISRRVPSFEIPRTNRIMHSYINTPSPIAYEPSLTERVRKKRGSEFSRSIRKLHEINNTPGVGKYKVERFLDKQF